MTSTTSGRARRSHRPRPHRSRLLLVIGVALALAACGTGGGGSAGAADPGPVRVSYLSASGGLPVLVADQQGFFTKHGVTAQLTGVPNPSAALQVLGRDFDVVQGTPTDLALAAANGRDIKAFSAAYQESSAASLFHLLAPTDIRSAADLRGRKVAAPSLAGISYIGLINFLGKAGLQTTDVTLVQVAYPDVDAQLKAGIVDAALSVTPFSTGTLQDPAFHDLGDPVLSIGDPVLIGVYIATSEWLQADPARASAYIAAIDEANTWIRENEDAARAILVRDLKMPDAAAAAVELPEWRTDLSGADLQPWLTPLVELGAAPENSLPAPEDLVSQP